MYFLLFMKVAVLSINLLAQLSLLYSVHSFLQSSITISSKFPISHLSRFCTLLVMLPNTFCMYLFFATYIFCRNCALICIVILPVNMHNTACKTVLYAVVVDIIADLCVFIKIFIFFILFNASA